MKVSNKKGMEGDVIWQIGWVRDLFMDMLNVNVEGKVSWPIQLQTSLKLTKGILCCMYLPSNKCLVEVVLGTYELSRLPLFHSSVLFLLLYFYFYTQVQIH